MDYQIISTDDHLQEAPHTWTARMSTRKWGDLVPQVKEDADGSDAWFVYGKPRSGGFSGKLGVVSGAMPDRAKFAPVKWDEMPRISYIPAERVQAMDQDGVDVHTFFGNVSGVAGNTFQDPQYPEGYRVDAIRAYNDFQVEEWAQPYPGRFITLAQLPMSSVAEASGEAVRAAGRGFKGITFAFPQQWGYPHIADPYWDPLWAVAEEAGLSLNFHIGTGGSMGLDRASLWEGQSDMFQLAALSTWSISSNTQVMSILLFSGILDRFPRLNIVASESGIGWAPYLLELADHQWERQKLFSEGMALKPSDVFKRQCYVNFWFEVFGSETRHHVGIDNIMWESDFPHPTCTWPTSKDYIERGTEGWPEEERRKVLVENAAKLYHLP